MKTLVIADLHLRNAFDQRLFDFLKNLISDAQQVIINGDLIEGDLAYWQDIFSGKWSKLWELFSKKKSIYILGNHDSDIEIDELKKLNIFSEIGTSYNFIHQDMKVHVEHGHRFTNESPLRSLPRSLLKPVAYVNRIKDSILDQIWPYKGKNKIDYKQLKNAEIETNPEADIFILSHTHQQYADEDEKIYNTGSIRFGFASWITIEDGKVKIHKAKY